MKRQHILATPVLLFLLVLVGCGSASTGSGASHQPTALHVTRTSNLAMVQSVPFDRTIQDSATVQQLYDAALALPVANGVYNCPIDRGVAYHLQFLQGTAPLQQMDLDATGCRFLHITGQADARVTNDAFIALFTTTVGVKSLFP